MSDILTALAIITAATVGLAALLHANRQEPDDIAEDEAYQDWLEALERQNKR